MKERGQLALSNCKVNYSFIHLFIYSLFINSLNLLNNCSFFLFKGGESRVVGIYFPENGTIVFSGADLLWQGSFCIV